MADLTPIPMRIPGDPRDPSLPHSRGSPGILMGMGVFPIRPVWARGRCRISPPRFLAECCERQLNQVSLVLLFGSAFSDLYWVCLSVFPCTVLFVSISQVIGCEDRLRNDLYYVEWAVKLYSNQPTSSFPCTPLNRCRERARRDG